MGVKTKMALYVNDTWGTYVVKTWRLIADVTKTGNREWVMSTGNGKMKIRTRKRMVMNLLIGLGFKLSFVPIFHFPVLFGPSPFPFPRFINLLKTELT